jgi:hypothetical protein
VNGYLSKPFDLQKIPEADLDAIKRLKEMGIKNTRQIFKQAYQFMGRVQLSARSEIQQERLLELVSLVDLARVCGVGTVFARIFYTAEIKNVYILANNDLN